MLAACGLTMIPMSWQLPIAILIVLAAAAYLARRTWRTLTGRKAGGCAGCGGTPTDVPRTVISEEQLTVRLRQREDANGLS